MPANFVRLDAIETGIDRAGLVPGGGLGVGGYVVANQTVRSMLRERLDVVVDAVNPVGAARERSSTAHALIRAATTNTG